MWTNPLRVVRNESIIMILLCTASFVIDQGIRQFTNLE